MNGTYTVYRKHKELFTNKNLPNGRSAITVEPKGAVLLQSLYKVDTSAREINVR